MNSNTHDNEHSGHDHDRRDQHDDERRDRIMVTEALARLAELESAAEGGARNAEELAGPDQTDIARQRTFSEGEVSGLQLAARTIRELAGWPVEADSDRT